MMSREMNGGRWPAAIVLALILCSAGIAAPEGSPCGAPGSGSCFDAYISAGCDDEICCLVVCTFDPICCKVIWDYVCASEAKAICGICSAPAAGAQCREDFDGDGDVGGADLGLLLGAWDTTSGATLIDLNHDFRVDSADVGLLLAAWGPCVGGRVFEEREPCGESLNEGCGAPAESGSDCCTMHESPGCDTPACSAIVCAQDISCCRIEWDGSCAGLAKTLCDPLCDPPKSAFTPIAPGETVKGTVFGDGVTDQDWYEFTLTESAFVTWLVSTQFAGLKVNLYNAKCPAAEMAWSTEFPGGQCGHARMGACLGAGTYRAVVTAPADEFFLCGNGKNAYTATLLVDSEGCTPSADQCADAYEIFEGDTPFSNLGATADGVLPDLCPGTWKKDVWFTYMATCTGTLTVSTCNSATYDTFVALYLGCDPAQCPPGNTLLLACNNDAGCGDHTSIVMTHVVEGTCYRIRVAGFGGLAGVGVLHVECAAN